MNGQRQRFYGKYRGVVTDNRDPNNLGRIRARVQDVYGDEESGWAMPSVPYAGSRVGLYLIPPQRASVWIEFEHGDPDYPVWSGCFWAASEMPLSPVSPDKKVLKTDAGTLTFDDTQGAGGITIETTAGLKIKMDQNGIEISNGAQKILLSASSVSVNSGALEVT
jgi:uncharacterized protein involved in type VI secretion and phage assembly